MWIELKGVLAFPALKTKRQLRVFLGLAGYCRKWIPNFFLIAQPLYNLLEQDQSEPLCWKVEHSEGKETLKEFLTKAPNYDRPFSLSVLEQKGTALGALTQQHGGYCWPRILGPTARFGRKHHPLSPSCHSNSCAVLNQRRNTHESPSFCLCSSHY